MEAQVSEILENILGMLGLEGSFEVNEEEDQIKVTIDTDDAGRLIGNRGETLDALQLLVNQILSQKQKETEVKFKRVIIDVAQWRKGKEEDLLKKAQDWASKVKESGQELELEPMPSWQRRIIHMTISEVEGVWSESIGEGGQRHLIIRPGTGDKKDQKEADSPETTEE